MLLLVFSSTALTIFYVLYKWLLSHDTLHRFNRIVILVLLAATTLFPFVAPFLHLRLGTAASEMSVQLRELVVSPDRSAHFQAEYPQVSLIEALTPFTAMQEGAMLMLSLAVTAVLLFVLFYRMEGLRQQCHGAYETLADGTRLVLHDNNYAPFSWMRYVVCSRSDYAKNGQIILAHEREHLRLHHSWDLLLVQVCCAVQWFNPAAWLMKHELQAVHEYEADEAMLRAGCNAQEYQMRLIETALGARFSSIANNFTNVSTKKRILMMMKKSTSPWARLKVLMFIPVAAAVVFAVSCTQNPKTAASSHQSEGSTAPVVNVVAYSASTGTEATEQTSDFVLACEVLPEYPGGIESLMKDLSQKLRYPKEAQEHGIEGRVIVQFIVEKDGSVTNVEVANSVDPQLDAEAVRVIRDMPKWTPGKEKGEAVRCKMTLPIAFHLSK